MQVEIADMGPDALALMRDKAEAVGNLLRLLSAPKRLLILCHLGQGERAVGQLAHLVGTSEAAMSQQLALLRREGLVRTRREGQSIHYSLARPDVARLIAFLHETYCGPGA